MSDIPSSLPANPSLEQLHKKAKDRLRERRAAGDAGTSLAAVQLAIAREHGFATWAALKHHVIALRPIGIAPFEKLATDLAAAYMSGDETMVRALNSNFATAFPTDFHDPEEVRQCLPTWYASETRPAALATADARHMIAQTYGFENWPEFAASITDSVADPHSAAVFSSAQPPFYAIDWQQNRLTARGPQTPQQWQRIFALVREHAISQLQLGNIADEAMKGLALLECVTHLNVAGSQALTDAGAQHLAAMPQLLELEMGGGHTSLTNRAFEPLRHLTQLRRFQSCWTQGFSDEAAAHLANSNLLENVNVMGSSAGDGLIRAMAGKTALRFLNTGRGVTDAGILHLHNIPAFKNACGECFGGDEIHLGVMGASNLPNQLLMDGHFTDSGLANLAGLDGLAALSFFWHSKAFTAAGLASLRRLPRLEVFGIDGSQCGDDVMRQIASLPRLRQLQSQGAVASDAGWQALSRSQTLEYIWGRECPNFTSLGFTALAALPTLRGIGIGCKRVSDRALAALPSFPQLRQFVSIDVPEAAFRHIGQCHNLESLYCMYCRDTGDAATEHIAALPKLQTYYAGMTQITDRSLTLLSGMPTLERLEFWQCMALTDAGVAHLALLPNLQQLEIHNSPKVSPEVRRFFRETVRVLYSR